MEVEADAAAGEVQDVLRAVARPRRVGSAGAAEVGADLRRRLTALGYEVRVLPFSFSDWPGRFGVPVAGAAHLAGSFVAGTLLREGWPGTALLVLVLVAAIDVALALTAPMAMRRLGVGRVEGENLIAARPGARPRWIVMAHRDSKSQPIPTALRGAALAAAAGSWLVLVAIALVALLGPVPVGAVLLAGSVGVVGGALMLFSWVGDTSPGALDNASGIATLMAVAARQNPEANDVAFVITDGEEMGLCGARSLATRLPPIAGVINIDGIDDEGPFHIVERFGRPRRGLAPHLAAPLLSAAAALNHSMCRRDAPFGILLDHMPLVDAGLPALTLMRGRARSLLRVHTPADDLTRLRGTGAAEAAELVSLALAGLRRAEPSGDERVAHGGVRG